MNHHPNNETAHKAQQLLNDLGDTPHDIAKALQQLGITGIKRHDGQCPLARYLKTHIPFATVARMFAIVAADSPGIVGEVELTTAQSAFIEQFDQGSYPDITDNTDYVPRTGNHE
jgi:hypothetical protein